MIQGNSSLNGVEKNLTLSYSNENPSTSRVLARDPRQAISNRTLLENNFDGSEKLCSSSSRDIATASPEDVYFKKDKRRISHLNKINPEQICLSSLKILFPVDSNQSSTSSIAILGVENVAPTSAFIECGQDLVPEKQVTSKSVASMLHATAAAENFSHSSPVKRSAPLLQKTRRETTDIKRNIVAHSKKHAHMHELKKCEPKTVSCKNKSGAVTDHPMIKRSKIENIAKFKKSPPKNEANAKWPRHISAREREKKHYEDNKVPSKSEKSCSSSFEFQERSSSSHDVGSMVKLNCPQQKGILKRNSSTENELSDSESQSEDELPRKRKFKRIRVLSDSEENDEKSPDTLQQKQAKKIVLPFQIVTLHVSDVIPNYKEKSKTNIQSCGENVHPNTCSEKPNKNVETKSHEISLDRCKRSVEPGKFASEYKSLNSDSEWMSGSKPASTRITKILPKRKAEKHTSQVSSKKNASDIPNCKGKSKVHPNMYPEKPNVETRSGEVSLDRYERNAEPKFADEYKYLNNDAEPMTGSKPTSTCIAKILPKRVTEKYTSQVSCNKVECTEAGDIDAEKEITQRTLNKDKSVNKSNSHEHISRFSGPSHGPKEFTYHDTYIPKSYDLKKLSESVTSEKTFMKNKGKEVFKPVSFQKQHKNSVKQSKTFSDMHRLPEKEKMKQTVCQQIQSTELKDSSIRNCTGQSNKSTSSITSKGIFTMDKRQGNSHIHKSNKQSNKLQLTTMGDLPDNKSEKVTTTTMINQNSGFISLSSNFKEVVRCKSQCSAPVKSTNCSKASSQPKKCDIAQDRGDNILNSVNSEKVSNISEILKENTEAKVMQSRTNSGKLRQANGGNLLLRDSIVVATDQSEGQHRSQLVYEENSHELGNLQKQQTSGVKQSKMHAIPRKQDTKRTTECQQMQSSKLKDLNCDAPHNKKKVLPAGANVAVRDCDVSHSVLSADLSVERHASLVQSSELKNLSYDASHDKKVVHGGANSSLRDYDVSHIVIPDDLAVDHHQRSLMCLQKEQTSGVKPSKMSRWDMREIPKKQNTRQAACQQMQISRGKGASYDDDAAAEQLPATSINLPLRESDTLDSIVKQIVTNQSGVQCGRLFESEVISRKNSKKVDLVRNESCFKALTNTADNVQKNAHISREKAVETLQGNISEQCLTKETFIPTEVIKLDQGRASEICTKETPTELEEDCTSEVMILNEMPSPPEEITIIEMDQDCVSEKHVPEKTPISKKVETLVTEQGGDCLEDIEIIYEKNEKETLIEELDACVAYAYDIQRNNSAHLTNLRKRMNRLSRKVKHSKEPDLLKFAVGGNSEITQSQSSSAAACSSSDGAQICQPK